MTHEFTEVVVVGAACGLAISRALAGRDLQVTAIGRPDGVASTFTNQKWKHTGLLYANPVLAKHLWKAFSAMDPLESSHLRNRGAHYLALKEETMDTRATTWKERGLPFQRLASDAVTHGPELGPPSGVGGFLTGDSVIDFAAMLEDLKADAERQGVATVAGNVQRLIRDADAIRGVIYERAGKEIMLHANHVVLAMGAWATEALRLIGVELPIRSFKCNVLTVDTELVPCITCFLDGPGVTFVPFRGTTLIADTRRIPARDGFDRAPVPEMVEQMKADVAAQFPAVRWGGLKAEAHACIKTEFTEANERNHESAIFGSRVHGVVGLTVALPGKASLMFSLARHVAKQVAGSHCHAPAAHWLETPPSQTMCYRF
jgi:glycine/D-amino acid oxidase-like deaminating enzyme